MLAADIPVMCDGDEITAHCSMCEHEYEVVGHVSYSFSSPTMITDKKGE